MATALDPRDPRCPACDDPIGATATYCMHCYTDIEREGATSPESDGLVALPTVAFSESMTGGDFVGRVFLFVVGEVLFGLVALVLVAIGYVGGKKARRSGA